MLNLLKSCVVAISVLFAAVSHAAEAGTTETLIDGGKGLENWNQTGSGNWSAQADAIVADAGSGLLVSKKSYGDFRLVAEFWADHTTNSGIFIRADDPSYINAYSAYEVNIFDQRSDPTYGTGGIVGVAKVDPMPKAGGQWNTYEIVAKGDQLIVTLNGVETVNTTSDRHDSGPIALQIGYGAGAIGAIKWRKVTVEEL
ncbi:DUF1080 domain-containing protein [Neiella marina]|uniref:DUF1080 domain-containing protein n=1 Tax=Neiella holothuriorum TaxID=2870530 RepID=A0ABS7EFX3_9GAMM|nr:DUF1080 domain-containing protein [Neiella holothuriorum]MBW8191160.1 DUF1080 domain-containing protein [Neiella holothuriorum]